MLTMNLKIIYAAKELKTIRGELMDELIFELDNDFEIFESNIPGEKNALIRNAFVLGHFNELIEMLVPFSKDPTALYYQNVLKSRENSAEKIYQSNPYSLEDADDTYIWYLFDTARLKLFFDKNDDAKKLLAWGFKESFKGHEEYLASLRLLSIAFENGGDMANAQFFLKYYLSFRAEAVNYLNEKLEEITIKIYEKSKNDVQAVKNVIESFEILGPDHAENLKELIEKNRNHFEKLFPEMRLRYQRVLEIFELIPAFDPGADLSEIYKRLEQQQLLPTPQSPNS
jgi:hypothetical protein